MDFFLNETDYYSHRNYRNDLLDRNTQLGNYWIGFFLADGHLTDKGGLEFFQCTKNQPIVDKFNSYSKGTIKSTSPSMDKEGNRIYLQKSPVVDKYVKDFDVSTNMKDNPIFGGILNHIDRIKTDSRLLNAFIAGFIDGDGHITKKGKCRIELKSTWEPFLKKIKEVLGLNSNVNKRKNRDASYLDIRKSKMKELKKGQESFLGPRWERVLESFDFNSEDNYELGQPIIDRYKNIQILEDLISKFVYSHYPNNNNIVTPRVVLDNFIWRFFPYYYDTDDDYIEGISRDFGDKCKMTIIHTGTNFERYERKRINIEFPKKSTRKSFIEECSRKMAEGLVDAGIDMKYLVTEKTELSESFDFNSNDDYELGQPIIDRYKNIQTLENLISKFVYSHYPNDKAVVTPGLVFDSFIWRFFPFYYDNKNDFIDCFSCDADDKFKMTIIHGGEDLEQHERKRIKIEFPNNNTRKSFVENCSRKMAEGLVDAGIDMKHLVPEKTDLSELTESFDFNSETDGEELGQDIIDRYKSIQFLSELIYEYAERAFSSRCTARPWPISAMSKFLDDYFQYYYTPNETNETISYSGHKDNENFNVFIELIKNDKPISKVKIEIPVVNKKEIDKTLFVKECSRKIAEGLVDAGIDINHIESSTLSESFDFNSEIDDEESTLDNTVNKLKRIALLSRKINDVVEYMKERLEEVNDSEMEGVSFLDNILFNLFSHIEDPYEAVDFDIEGSVDEYDNYILFVPVKEGIIKKSSQKVYLPKMVDLNKNVSSYVRAIAKALVEIGADEMCNLFESFDFENDLEDGGVERDIEAIKKKHEYERLCISTFDEVLRENLIVLQDGLLNPSPHSKKSYSPHTISVGTLLDWICSGHLFQYLKWTSKSAKFPDKDNKTLNYSIYYEAPFQKKRTLCSFDWDKIIEIDKKHIKDFLEYVWSELATPENGLFIGNKLLRNHLRKRLIENNLDEYLDESFDFGNEEEYDLGIDKISTYYKICEKELEKTLENNTIFGEDSTYNIALILRDFLYQIGLEAFELFMSDVKYPKGKIHFIYDDTERCQWNTIIVGNREETKKEIKRMFVDILKDEEVFYDLTEIIKEKKMNESFDFNSEDNYEQELDDEVSKIKKFQEWNFKNGFNILENFYSLGLKEDPNMKVYAYPSVSLLINILYPIDKSLTQGNTREVRVTISENQSRNNGTGLYFRNNKTGKISYKVFPYEYTIKEFKDKWAYLVIEALEEIGASKSTLMRNDDLLYESFDFSNDNEDSLLEKISEICLIRKIIEEFRESVEKTFKAYYVIDTKELYTISAYKLYLNKIQDYIYKKSKELFDIDIYWIKNTEKYAMDIKVVNGAGEKFMMRVPYKLSFEELSDVEFPKVLKGIINNMPDYKEMLMRNF